MFFGMNLGVPECFNINNIELDMMSVPFEICSDEVAYIADPLLSFEDTWIKFLI